jgi:3-methyl-2-oxobutanoate hydroxymethyltransferase
MPASRKQRTIAMTETLYGTSSTRRVTIRDLQNAKLAGDRWPMLTAYDYSTAGVFDAAGVPRPRTWSTATTPPSR